MHQSYVPLTSIGGRRLTELNPDALVGCMRGLGSGPERFSVGKP